MTAHSFGSFFIDSDRKALLDIPRLPQKLFARVKHLQVGECLCFARPGKAAEPESLFWVNYAVDFRAVAGDARCGWDKALRQILRREQTCA